MATKFISEVKCGDKVSFFGWVDGRFALARGTVKGIIRLGGKTVTVWFTSGRCADVRANGVALIE